MLTLTIYCIYNATTYYHKITLPDHKQQPSHRPHHPPSILVIVCLSYTHHNHHSHLHSHTSSVIIITTTHHPHPPRLAAMDYCLWTTVSRREELPGIIHYAALWLGAWGLAPRLFCHAPITRWDIANFRAWQISILRLVPGIKSVAQSRFSACRPSRCRRLQLIE